MHAVKRLARTILKPSQPLPYHEEHAKVAGTVRKSIESRQGKLPTEVERQCDDYAIEVLGSKKYAPWLYVYSLVAGRFKEGWIPDNFYGANVIAQMKGHYGNFANLKPLNSAFFRDDAFPDLGSFVNGLFMDNAYNVLSPAAFQNMLFDACDRVVFKTDRSSQGLGIHFFDRHSFDADAVARLGNGVFQRYVVQHPLFNEYARNSVATLRMTTAMNDQGQASVRAAFLRLGQADDTHVQSQTQIRIPVDMSTGEFNEVGFMRSWLTTPEHPTSGKAFANVHVPNFARCVDVVTALHRKVPYVRCIGWDVTVDCDGNVVILEWNGAHNDIRFGEATQGPGFRDFGWERFR